MYDSQDDGQAVNRASMAQVLAFIDACQGDPAFLGPIAQRLAASAPKLFAIKKQRAPRPEIVQFPDLTKLAAMQLSFFDNGADAGFQRYKFQAEFWSGEARFIELADRDPGKVTVQLLNARQLKRQLTYSKAASLDQDWKDTMQVMLANLSESGGDWRLGGVFHVGGKVGSKWITGQMIAAKIDEDGTPEEAIVFNGQAAIRVTEFDVRTHADKRLKGNIKRMARVDLCGENEFWRTELLSPSSI